MVCRSPSTWRACSVERLRLKDQPGLGRYPAFACLRGELLSCRTQGAQKASRIRQFRQNLAPRGTSPPTSLLCSLLMPIEPDSDPSADPSSLHKPLQLEVTDFQVNRLTPAHVHRSPSLEAILINSPRTPFRVAHPRFDPTMNPHEPMTHPDHRLSPKIHACHQRPTLTSIFAFANPALKTGQTSDTRTDKPQKGFICPSAERTDPDLSTRCIP